MCNFGNWVFSNQGKEVNFQPLKDFSRDVFHYKLDRKVTPQNLGTIPMGFSGYAKEKTHHSASPSWFFLP